MLQRILQPSLLRAAFATRIGPNALMLPAIAVGAFNSTSNFYNPVTESRNSASAPSPPPPPPPASSAFPNQLVSAQSAEDNLRLLPLLRAQPSHYIRVHIQGFPFLVTRGDTVTLPFRIKGVSAGDVLRLTHASVLGSRDYTMKGAPYIDEKLFSCRALVVEETSEPLRIKEKTKRRNRKVKIVKSKHPYTVIRIRELDVSGEEDAA